MKKLTAIVLLASASIAAFAQDMSANVQREATKCAKAVISGDYNQVVAYTHKRVIERMGGKEAMISLLKLGAEEMETQGFSFEDVTVGTPKELNKVGDWLVAFVPQKIVIKGKAGQIVQESHLLGISEDNGKSWAFINAGTLTKEMLAEIFPELAGKIVLPPSKQPVFK